MGIRILVIEDEPVIADFVIRGLREEAFTVEHAADAEDAWHALSNGPWDVVLLDWWLPAGDGLSLLRRYRQTGNTTPVLFLTARDAVTDRVRGLDSGADDYLCKPFVFEELLARVRALARRNDRTTSTALVYRDVHVDLATHRVERAGKRLDLTAKEHALLVLFLRHPGEVLSRTRIYEQVWDERYDGLSNTLEVHVMEVRRKLEAHGPRLIHTLRGRGYRFGRGRRGTRVLTMTLITRLSLFVLAALGLVLAGFCLTLYVAARTYLYRQVDNGLESALNVLAAAAELDSGFLEWEPQQRLLSLGTDTGPSPVLWLVRDDQGHRVDGFPQQESDTALTDLPAGVPTDGPVFLAVDWRGQPWRLAQGWVQSQRFARSLAGIPPVPPQEIKHGRYAALSITVASPLQPVRDTLATLGAALAGVSLGILAFAGVASRWFCRRALRPVTQMAASARQMGADPSQRLPCADTHDELADLGTAFNALLDRLQESFERQRRFTGDASHQLRTPLTGMLGQVEVALRHQRSSEEYQHALRTVRAQVLQMRGIVEALLFLARGDAEADLSALERLDLAQWLGIHLEAWRGHPRKADIHMEIPSGATFLVEAHSTLLGQLVDNLLDNACKYSAPGASVTLRLWRDQASVFLAIEDEGAGIAREELGRVFQPFYRSPLARRVGTAGVGLGLAVADRIAAALGGELTVTSELNRGSCFTLRLPESDTLFVAKPL